MISVVIPAHNAVDVLPAQLAALARQDYDQPWQVIVVDDHSTDFTADVAGGWKGRLDLVVHTMERKARNAAEVRNAGIELASGDALLFCDADDVVGEGWLAAMATALQSHDLVACRVDIDRLNPPWLVSARDLPQTIGLQLYGTPPFMPHAGGGTLGMTRRLLDDIGLFDPSPGLATQEGAEFCIRAQLAGYELHFVSDALLHVRSRETLATVYRQSRGWGQGSVAVDLVFADHGLEHSSASRAMVGWAAMGLRLLTVRGRAEFAWWLHRLGWKVGRLRGSIGNRVFMP